MRWALLLVLGCGGTIGTTSTTDVAEPTCVPIDAGVCHDGWETLQFYYCEPGATPAATGCAQDDYDASPYWCCPTGGE